MQDSILDVLVETGAKGAVRATQMPILRAMTQATDRIKKENQMYHPPDEIEIGTMYPLVMREAMIQPMLGM